MTKAIDWSIIICIVFGGAWVRFQPRQMVFRCVFLLIAMAMFKCVAMGFPVFNVFHTFGEIAMSIFVSSDSASSAVKVVIEVAAEIGFATAAHLFAEGHPPLYL
ncbi:hypothetical protein [Paraburkholderia tropica]|uniref:hypothetical protein n=1 Tax=Paraburkholderia tropica TaxID=92647 RepID=UPI002AB782C0|nr:hypothetical protein [Paraburkholderia tropica]